MSFGNGFKRILNVIIILWFLIGYFVIGFGENWQMFILVFVIVPLILRFTLFYIIDGFSKE